MDPHHYQRKSTHVSKYRFSPKRVVEWTSFSEELNDYWGNKVPQTDKDACIMQKDIRDYLFRTFLPDPYGRCYMDWISTQLPALMRTILNGEYNNPISPSDAHSAFKFDRTEDDVGIILPRFNEIAVLRSEDSDVPQEWAIHTAAAEMRNATQITPQDIDQFFQSKSVRTHLLTAR
jgi:hypothetical protein